MKKIIGILSGLLVLGASLGFAQKRTSKTSLQLFNEGSLNQAKGNYWNAVENFRESLQVNPSFADAWFHLSQCCYELEEYQLCIEYAQEALKYVKDSTDLNNIQGMALISLGKLKEAGDIFDQVLKTHPNDVEARFGKAQLNLFDGGLSAAESLYVDALKRDGTNKKALVSLALLSAELGKDQVSENYIQQALSYHSGDAKVHYMAAYLAAKKGDYVQAERRARSAAQIDGNWDKAYEILSQIIYLQNRNLEVLDISDFRIGRNPNLASAWYMKGLAQSNLGRYEEAFETWEGGLEIFPQDEVLRLALEQLVADQFDIEDPRRNKLSDYHLAKAQEVRNKFEGEHERYEIQKALSINPLSIRCRQFYADTLRRDKYWELYLEQLKFIESIRPESGGVQKDENSPKKSYRQVQNTDTIEGLESMMADNLAHQWNVEPFYLDKTRWSIGLYYLDSGMQLIHPDAPKVYARAQEDAFSSVSSASLNIYDDPVSGFGDGYRLARKERLDYFILLKVQEMERSVSLDAEIYSGRSGTKITEVHVYRTGNNRVNFAIAALRKSILNILPIRGKIIAQKQKTLLVDLGKSDGVTKESTFDVVAHDAVTTKDKGTGVSYKSEDVLGTATIDVLNEEISQIVFTKKGFYDLLNPGDEVVLTSFGKDRETENIESDTRPKGDSQGVPADRSAELKESLKIPFRDSQLLNLIRSL